MKKLKILPLLLAALMLFGCAQGPSDNNQAITDVDYPTPTTPADQPAIAIPEDYLSAIEDFSAFSAGTLMSESKLENELYSPASLYFALAMLSECACGETKAQLLSTLGVPEDSLAANTQALYKLLSCNDAASNCALYNSAWLSDAFSFKQATTDKLAKDYFTECFTTDFFGSKYTADISKWISEHTNGMLGSDSAAFEVSPDTAMLLFNTIYYKDEWKTQFDKANTQDGDFASADGGTTTCEFMNSKVTGGFLDYDSFTAASLGLKNGEIRFILPDEGVSPYDIISDRELLRAALFTPADVFGSITWQIPKLDYASTLQLTDMLGEMGVTDALSPEYADFSALSDNDIFLSGALQQSRVSLNENGVEAATYTELLLDGSDAPSDGHAEMLLTRPFIYVISRNGIPMFVGVINEME